jgi:hypothetical protein
MIVGMGVGVFVMRQFSQILYKYYYEKTAEVPSQVRPQACPAPGQFTGWTGRQAKELLLPAAQAVLSLP